MNLIKKIKENGQDFEFYPTTKEIINAMYWDLVGKKYDESNYRANGKRFTFLDVGAGNCKVLSTIKEIEKEQPLLEEFFYDKIPNEEIFQNAAPLKILSRERYGKDFKVVYRLDGEEHEEIISLSQFMVMLINNTTIEKVDMTALEVIKDGYSKSEKEIVLDMIEEWEAPRSYRNKNERQANRVFISKYMAIEKSQILIDNMPKEAFVVGTDFNENTLIDKQADIVFCNPPYSEYSQWSERIIKEANAKVIYLVIPRRWGKQANIAGAIKARKAKVSIVGNFDFFNSEDRKARAYVSLVKVDLRGKAVKSKRGWSQQSTERLVDPFDLWFNENFKINAKKAECDYEKREREAKEKKEKVENAVVKGGDLVSSLVELYNSELSHLVNNYQKVAELDSDILKELNVDVDSVLSAFKEKIKGLKNFYWQEIFNNLDSITKRLTSRTRKRLLGTLMGNTSIDFTTGNIRSVVIWVIKNANKYFEEQMLEVYDDFTTDEGISLYKSNQRFNDDSFRYCKSDKSFEKYSLDYRMVLHGYRSNSDWNRDNKLSHAQMDYFNDIRVIASNLGFEADALRWDAEQKVKHEIFFSKNSQTEPYKKGSKVIQGKILEVYCQSHLPNENGEDFVEKDGITYVYRADQEESYYQYKILDSNGYEYYLNHDCVRTQNDIFTTVRGHGNGNVHFQFNKEFIKKLNLEVGRLRGWIKTPKEAAENFDISEEEAQNYWGGTFQLLPSSSELKNLLPDYSKKETEVSEEKIKVVFADDVEPDEDFKESMEMLINSDLSEDKVREVVSCLEYSESDIQQILEAQRYNKELLEKQAKKALEGGNLLDLMAC